MNWKIIFIGGVSYYVAQFLLSFITGPLLHEGLLDPLYQANSQFWRPELNQDPPDMAALMPRWIATGLLASFIHAGIYGHLRGAFNGASWIKGLKFGFVVFLIYATASAGWSGIFNLPDVIWGWWTAEAVLYYLLGGAVLGWVAQKVAPEGG